MDFDLALSIAVLARTPFTLKALLGGLAEAWVRGPEGADTFSAFDVVGHLSRRGGDGLDSSRADLLAKGRIHASNRSTDFATALGTRADRSRRCSTSSRLRAANLALLRSWRLSKAELDLPARTRAWAESRFGSCWPRGPSTTSGTSRRSRE